MKQRKKVNDFSFSLMESKSNKVTDGKKKRIKKKRKLPKHSIPFQAKLQAIGIHFVIAIVYEKGAINYNHFKGEFNFPFCMPLINFRTRRPFTFFIIHSV